MAGLTEDVSYPILLQDPHDSSCPTLDKECLSAQSFLLPILSPSRYVHDEFVRIVSFRAFLDALI